MKILSLLILSCALIIHECPAASNEKPHTLQSSTSKPSCPGFDQRDTYSLSVIPNVIDIGQAFLLCLTFSVIALDNYKHQTEGQRSLSMLTLEMRYILAGISWLNLGRAMFGAIANMLNTERLSDQIEELQQRVAALQNCTISK